MSRRKTNTRRRGAKTRRAGPVLTQAAARRLGVLTLWALTAVGVVYGLENLDSRVRAAHADGAWHAEWTNLPPTLDSWILEEVERNAGIQDGGRLHAASLWKPDLCRIIGTEVAASPWVESVRRVGKEADGKILIEAEFRQYLTFVVRAGMGFLVDVNGVRLPRELTASALDGYQMLLLEGVEAPPPRVGEQWQGEDIANGLKLVRYLNRYCPTDLLHTLKAVDVANNRDRLNGRDGWLRIRSVYSDFYTSWGRPPGEEYEIECSAGAKFERLWSFYKQHARLPRDLRDHDSVIP